MKTPRKHQNEAIEAINKINEGIIKLPTGSGKTFIQTLAIERNITNGFNWVGSDQVPVFVILSPRILLSNQLYLDVKEELVERNKDCQYLIVHSGRTEDKKNWKLVSKEYNPREIKSTTRISDIQKEYNKAQEEKVPLIIFGTYDSSERIVNSEIPVYMLLCDEAHYLVTEEFGWIPHENESPEVRQFNAYRKYYFTATLKETASDNSIGMNNERLFGPIIYTKTPQELIIAGEIIRPRMHLVDVPGDGDSLDKDVNAIIESFKDHRVNVNVLRNVGAKMLVVTRGTEDLNDIVHHERMQTFLKDRPTLTIFDISSYYHPRINGKVIKREKFLFDLKNLKDHEEAIILHINILTEGIDVPGISGVMFMNNIKLSKFLQTLGRATRLHDDDRKKLYNGTLLSKDLHKFVKPYAWIIIPIYDETIGDDIRQRISNFVYALRSYGFKASEDVVIRQKRGIGIPIQLEQQNKPDTLGFKSKQLFLEVTHEIEAKEEADKLILEDFRLVEKIKNESDQELINSFLL